MKTLRKIVSLFAVVCLVICCASTAFAANTTPHEIIVRNDEAGHVYEAYQIFKGNYADNVLTNVEWGNGVNFSALLTDLAADTGVLAGLFTTSDTAEDVAEILSDESFTAAQADAFAEYVGDNLATVAGTSSEASTPYTIDVVGDGYYLLIDKDGTADNDAYTKYILRVAGNIDVTAKSDAPTLTKTINGGGDANSVAVGDTISYKLTSNVPNMDGYEKYFFVIHDSLSDGLTFDADSVEVMIDGGTYTGFTVTPDSDTAGADVKIVFNNFIAQKGNAGKEIVITYSAVVNDSAVAGNTGNSNSAYLVYSNNPNVDLNGTDEPADGDEVSQTTPDTVISYMTQIVLTKVDGSDTTKKLPGAVFTVKKGSTTIGTYTTGADGTITVSGLAEGTYTITEDTAPSTYNKLTEAITVTITCEEPANVSDATTAATWKFSTSGAVVTAETTASDGIIRFNVENNMGATLPSTGGMGTTLFYVFGASLIIVAIVLFTVKKRSECER